MAARAGVKAWAIAAASSGVAGLKLPPNAGELIVAPDGDAPGRMASNSLADRAAKHGWNVRVMEAPEGRDWNDVAMECWS